MYGSYFITTTYIYVCICSYVSENAQTQSASLTIDQLRREVEQIFNQRYGKMTPCMN